MIHNQWYAVLSSHALRAGEMLSARRFGDDDPDTEPDVFDLLTDSSFAYDHTEDFWNVHYSRVIENQLDVSHLAFVHRTTIGRGRPAHHSIQR